MQRTYQRARRPAPATPAATFMPLLQFLPLLVLFAFSFFMTRTTDHQPFA